MRKLLLWLLWFLLLLPCPALAQEHALTTDIDQGACRSLTGQVQLVVLFVDTPEAQWDPVDHVAFEGKISEAVDALEKEAAAYGTALSIEPETFSALVTKAFDDESYLLVHALLSVPQVKQQVNQTGLRETPLFLCLPEGGRSGAMSAYDEDMEYAILYANADTGSIRHELLHLYGAQDFYLQEEVKAAAKASFPDSIMLDADPACTVDSFTAWCIGWIEQPDAAAERFLADTAHITPEMMAASLEDTYVTGFTTRENEEGTYTGMMVDGLFHGTGTRQWIDGSSYTGQWVHGQIMGHGVYTSAKGFCYTGAFLNGKQSGKGVSQWPDGTCYTGDTSDGKHTGQGVLCSPDGSVYTGDFVDGVTTGKGINSWPDGSTYTGDFVDGVRTGKGILCWPDGTTYTGDFVDGVRTGKGILCWPDGSTYTGDFLSDAMTGTGIFEGADGSRYTGRFLDGIFHGQGSYTSPDGSLSTGTWNMGVLVP